MTSTGGAWRLEDIDGRLLMEGDGVGAIAERARREAVRVRSASQVDPRWVSRLWDRLSEGPRTPVDLPGVGRLVPVVLTDPASRPAGAPMARRSDPGTSWQAAQSKHLTGQEQRVLDALRALGEGTREDVAQRAGVAVDSTSTRLAALRRRGLVRDSGRRGPTRRGGTQTVWEPVPSPAA